MTGKAIDYSITPISFYKFVCIDPEIKSSYVGHTINFTERKSHHKKCCNGENYKSHHLKFYQMIRDHLGWDNWRMIEIEKRIVKDKREAERIETEYMEQLQSDMNCKKAHNGFETQQEYKINYHQKNRDKIIFRMKTYYQNNRDEYISKAKEYYQDHRDEIALKSKEKITCECGTVVTKNGLSQHKQKQKHKDLMETKFSVN